jgi:hypothetical protein
MIDKATSKAQKDFNDTTLILCFCHSMFYLNEEGVLYCYYIIKLMSWLLSKPNFNYIHVCVLIGIFCVEIYTFDVNNNISHFLNFW